MTFGKLKITHLNKLKHKYLLHKEVAMLVSQLMKTFLYQVVKLFKILNNLAIYINLTQKIMN